MSIITPEAAFNLIRSPGFKLTDLKEVRVSEHFTWAEVFQHRSLSEVLRAGLVIFQNALIQAQKMERIREYLRGLLGEVVIVVSSWYRSTMINNMVGGAKGSQHLLGLAVDFTVPGHSPAKIQALLIPQKDKIGFCLEITNGNWTHVDNRPSHIVFENLGKGQYKTLGVIEMQNFIRKYGRVA
jgi:zinc D-Ala-D-Ala carboxypeptidase